jgi:phasin
MNNRSNTPTRPDPEIRETLEKGTAQARGNYEQIGAAATEGAGLMESSISTTLKGVQEYNTKLLEFARTNTKAASDFFQQLSAIKSPTAFLELSTDHTQKQFEALTEQTRQLASLAQSATNAAAEPLKVGVAKAFSRVRRSRR